MKKSRKTIKHNFGLEYFKENWNRLATEDAFWSILTVKKLKGNKWGLKEFLTTGEEEIASIIKKINIPHIGGKKALDFGCGAGRLTQALAKNFKHVYGIDISGEMIKKAKEINIQKNIEYIVNEKPDLQIFHDASIDFICSLITLQHMEPIYIKKYLFEFIRILKKDGLAVFQIPSENSNFTIGVIKKIKSLLPKKILDIYQKIRIKGKIDMFSIEREEVIKLLQKEMDIISIEEDKKAGKNWISYTYTMRKK